MDGNGRWAAGKGESRLFGHNAGSKAIKDLVSGAVEQGVECLTVFAFSCDNKFRSEEEVSGLINLFISCLDEYIEELQQKGVRLVFIGDLSGLNTELHQRAMDASHRTAGCSKLTLTIAINFSGTWHIVETTKKLLAQDEKPDDCQIVNAFDSLLPSHPDLLIRTGGERRLSNFILYHLGYTELFFLEVKWPDFSKAHLASVIEEFGSRDRRYGRLSDG